jgi:hypothetical protein
VRAYHEREKLALEAAAALPRRRPANGVPRIWTTRTGKRKVRIFKNGCPGIKREPCPYHSVIRKDSKSGICSRCRKRLVWNGTVDSDQARAHIIALGRRGVGYKAVSDACGVSRTILMEVRAGRKKTIRATTEKRILGVDKGAVADGALIPALPSRRLLQSLVARGFTKTELARRLGSKSKHPALQFKRRRIEARSALKIARLYRNAGEPPPRRSRWGVVVCDCIRPLAFERNDVLWCGRCEKPALPPGVLRAALARELEQRMTIRQAFGPDDERVGGWTWEFRKTRVEKREEQNEIRRLRRRAHG